MPNAEAGGVRMVEVLPVGGTNSFGSHEVSMQVNFWASFLQPLLKLCIHNRHRQVSLHGYNHKVNYSCGSSFMRTSTKSRSGPMSPPLELWSCTAALLDILVSSVAKVNEKSGTINWIVVNEKRLWRIRVSYHVWDKGCYCNETAQIIRTKVQKQSPEQLDSRT
jgi:hypothetical protein